MKEKTIAIVGGGASGVSTFIHLVLKLIVNPVPGRVTLILIEKKEEVGPGLAYDTSQQGHLLNTSAGLMGIFAEEPHHFVEWMQARPDYISEKYPGTKIHADAYPPRSLYGDYLKETLHEYVALARQHGLEVQLRHDEAIDAEVSEARVVLQLASGLSVRADAVVLATGTPEANNFKHLEKSPRYLDSPWPARRILDTVASPDATVSILGASLTAIDAVITLTNNGHGGPIRMYSKDGLLPRVQSPQEVPFERQFLTMENIRKTIREQRRPLRVKDLWRLFKAEAERILGPQDDWTKFDRVDKPQLKLLREDLELALRGENCVANILFSTRYDSFDVWKLLPTDQKILFTKTLKAYSDINRHSIPVENARKLISLLESGQLSVTAHLDEVDWHETEGTFTLQTEREGTQRADYVINATGTAAAVEKMNIPLLQQLLKKKHLVPNPAGGVRADVHTMQLEVPGQPLAPLYGIGHLLVGELFDTNAVWFNVARVDFMTNDILLRLADGRS
ncbi:FAD/NAD(P)-binding protein [Rhabdobacter roseus]|uniref:Putative NAD(P)/FAD-binding protein YdhS n=1 Tax=Rhabdobacter roseus TaxID=1655419 RepID=A0A840TN84_9BACT|nr:FAD/NAD(P)-binding protein [Rhabdobacter roseus]MBB5283012.1 putative NAD(P)/FAD-binding protein YdhS [Rhabdobacter roseus]